MPTIWPQSPRVVLDPQLPCNLLDPGWRSPEFSAAASARPDVTIHVRHLWALRHCLCLVCVPPPSRLRQAPCAFCVSTTFAAQTSALCLLCVPPPSRLRQAPFAWCVFHRLRGSDKRPLSCGAQVRSCLLQGILASGIGPPPHTHTPHSPTLHTHTHFYRDIITRTARDLSKVPAVRGILL